MKKNHILQTAAFLLLSGLLLTGCSPAQPQNEPSLPQGEPESSVPAEEVSRPVTQRGTQSESLFYETKNNAETGDVHYCAAYHLTLPGKEEGEKVQVEFGMASGYEISEKPDPEGFPFLEREPKWTRYLYDKEGRCVGSVCLLWEDDGDTEPINPPTIYCAIDQGSIRHASVRECYAPVAGPGTGQNAISQFFHSAKDVYLPGPHGGKELGKAVYHLLALSYAPDSTMLWQWS